MKISKLSNKFFISAIFLSFLQLTSSFAAEPIDIWKVEKIVNKSENEDNKKENNSDDFFKKKVENKNPPESIVVNEKLDTNNIKLAGLYDPSENGLTIDMWSSSDGSDIKNTLEKINLIQLSSFSEKILDIALLTNSYVPQNNISAKEFLNFKFEYLKNKKDFELIKTFLKKNPTLKNVDNLVNFYADYYLSNSQLDKACEIFDFSEYIIDDYLLNFKIYCLINNDNKEQAQLLFDLRSCFNGISRRR